MKKTILIFVSLAGVALFAGCNQQTSSTPGDTNAANNTAIPTNATTAADSGAPAADTNILSNTKARESYAMGMYFGTGWKKNGVDVDPDMLLRGIKDVQSGGATLLTETQMRAALTQLQQSVMASRQKMEMVDAEKNQHEGEAFLAENKTKPGVVTLPDGLQFKIIKDGTGASPTPNDIVTVNYRGTFVDGTVFDSSSRAGHPVQFPVRGVIPGWTEALEKMKVGSKWDVYIPSNLAYGPHGPSVIGPDKTLIFEVELLGIKAGHAPAAPAQPLTSDIIKVPSAEEMKQGAKIETIKASDLPKMQQGSTN